VPKQMVQRIPRRTCRMVAQRIERQIPVRACRIVTQSHSCKVPHTTRRMVSEVKTRRVPFCVSKRVPYTTTRQVTRMVAKRVPVTQTKTVARCVQYQIPYEECVLVPQTVCPTPNCSDCGVGSGSLGGSVLNPGMGNSLLPTENTLMVPKPDPLSSDPNNGYEDERPETEDSPAADDGPVLPTAQVAAVT
jgi:hypothetical protein